MIQRAFTCPHCSPRLPLLPQWRRYILTLHAAFLPPWRVVLLGAGAAVQIGEPFVVPLRWFSAALGEGGVVTGEMPRKGPS